MEKELSSNEAEPVHRPSKGVMIRRWTGLVLQRYLRPWRWRWSSAAAHVASKDDGLVRVRPLLDLVNDWRRFVMTEADDAGV